MMKYRSRPVEIEAFRFYVDPIPDWFMDKVTTNEIILHDCNYRIDGNFAYCLIKTSVSEMRGNAGDYIIKGVWDEIYPCKPDIFKQTYEIINA